VTQLKSDADKLHSKNIVETQLNTNVEIASNGMSMQQDKTQGFVQQRNLVVGIGVGALLAVVGMRMFEPTKAANVSTANAKTSVTDASTSTLSVTAVKVEKALLDRTLKANGTVAAYELIPVTSPATGSQISEILADRGETVTKGQILARLDDSQLQAQLMQARGALAKAEARVAQLRVGTRSEEIAQAQEKVANARATVWQAESDLELVNKRVERNKTLKAEGAIAEDRLDEIITQQRTGQSNLQQVQANLREAEQRLAQLQAGETLEVIAQAEAELIQAKGQVQLVQAQLKDTVVVAPTAGQIAERNARIGDLVSSSEKLFTIIERGRLELRLTVPETQLSSISPGQKVRITGNTASNITLLGKVRTIDPMVKEDSRQAIVKVDLPTNSALKPGMFLQAAIVTTTTPGTKVAVDALLPQTDGSAIAYVLQKDNTVKAKKVEIGQITPNEKVEILNGLNSDDRVILKGAAYLKDGDRVEIIN
jgi:HlyD family secretion protein